MNKYKGVVVIKPWGYEYLTYETESLEFWILHIEKNKATSFHCHPNKKTVMIVLSGKVEITKNKRIKTYEPLDTAVFRKGIYHRTKALTDDVFVMEIENPKNKHDLKRKEDYYQRHNKSYADDTISKDVKKFHYVVAKRY